MHSEYFTKLLILIGLSDQILIRRNYAMPIHGLTMISNRHRLAVVAILKTLPFSELGTIAQP